MNSLQNPLDANYPQDVTQKPGENAVFIVYALKDLPDTIDKVKDVCANFSALIRSMRNRYPDMQFSCTIGFGADAWKRFFPEQGNPKELQPFEEIKGVKLTAVSTPGDLLFHIRCKQMGLCFEFASIIDQKLRGVVESIDETHGFRYRDGKAIIGFVDGTENPAVDEDPYRFAVIGDEDPEFMGGSYVFVQKYIHDMVAWNALPVEEQEKVIGRRKFNDVELSDEEKPKNAHNAVTNIGDDLKIDERDTSKVEEDITVNSIGQYIDSLIDKLPVSRREIFLLSRKEHLSTKEIAQRLSISERTVEAQIYRSLQFLRKYLAEEGILLWLLSFVVNEY